MGKHSKPSTRALPSARTSLMAGALVPVIGAFAVAATAGAQDAPQHAPAPVAHASASQHPVQPAGTSISHAAPKPARPAVTAAPATVAPDAPVAMVEPASVRDGNVPAVNFHAYQAASESIARTAPQCGIPWTLIAGIGRVESQHADNGAVDASGTLRTPIYGPTLDGTLAGNQVVGDTDGGRLDGDATHDRAVGPMQFLPSTWEKFGADGNGDGRIDPQNIFDAALTTARYLCDGNLDLRSPASQTTAVLKYNNSMSYVNEVLGFARSY